MTELMNNSLSDRFLNWKLFIQNCANLNDVVTRSELFEVGGDLFYLAPFSDLDLVNKDRIRLLTTWRDKSQFAYPSRFAVTEAKTKKWLEERILQNNQMVMFWITDNYLNLLGHIAIKLNENGEFEIDNVLRGNDSAQGLMTEAQKKLEIILCQEFNPKYVYLKVLESNLHAIAFYQRLKYSVIEFKEMRWKNSTDGKILIPGSPADENLLTMKKNLVDLTEVPKKILTAGPSISSREIVYVNKAVTLGWNLNHSNYIKLFEEKFAQSVGSKYAMATSSCTGALHLSLLALGIGPGDEVIVPDITWVATASAVAYVGAKPVFADVDPFTWNITVESIQKVLTDKTRAVIPVHLYGFGAPMAEILSFAKSNNLFVVEDAAPAIGVQINNKLAGTFGDFGCYSFQGAKLLVTGEGGMLVSDDERLIKKAWKIQDHGRKPGTFWIEELGYKYKMNNITAALGLAQIERVNVQVEKKREINQLYKELLGRTDCLSFQEEVQNTRAICWMTSIQFTKISRLDISLLAQFLAENHVDTRPVFPTIHSYPMWNVELDNPVASYISSNSINLPSGVALTNGSVTKISNLILKWIEKNAK
jgi:perosamine synthetase